MRNAIVGFVASFLLLFTAANMVMRTEAFGQRPEVDLPPSLTSAEVIALSSDVDAANQQVVVIDGKARVLSVYHINRTTGEVALKSVRNFRWDMQLDEFNGTSPLPREIRAMLEPRNR